MENCKLGGTARDYKGLLIDTNSSHIDLQSPAVPMKITALKGVISNLTVQYLQSNYPDR